MENKLNLLSQCVELLSEQTEKEVALNNRLSEITIKSILQNLKENKKIAIVTDNISFLVKDLNVDINDDNITFISMLDPDFKYIVDNQEEFLSKNKLDEIHFIYYFY